MTRSAPTLLALGAALAVLAGPARAEPEVDARLRTQVTATTALDAAVQETDLDLDTTLDAGFAGLLRPELSGSLALRDRRDLNAPPAGSALRDAWDLRPDRSQERFERGWLEFGDRLALRVGRQVDWAGAFVRYDGASVRLRRVPGIPQAIVFGGRRVALDATDDLGDAMQDPVGGGLVDVQAGDSTITATSLAYDHHLLDLTYTRRLGRVASLLEDARVSLGYAQLDLRPRDARVGAEAAFRRLRLRVALSADVRLLESEDELLFDYASSASRARAEGRDLRLYLPPSPPNVLLSARAIVHPQSWLSASVQYARRQLFDPAATTAFVYSHDYVSARADAFDPPSGLFGSIEARLWLPDLGDPPSSEGQPSWATLGEGERRSFRIESIVGSRLGDSGNASVGIALRSFDYVSVRARLDGVTAATITARATWDPLPFLVLSGFCAYDEAIPVLDQGLEAVLAAGLGVEVRVP